jgi:transposase-like protein
VIRLGNEQYWLYVTVDPDSNELLHTKLELTRIRVLVYSFFTERCENTTETTQWFSLFERHCWKTLAIDTVSISDTNVTVIPTRQTYIL